MSQLQEIIADIKKAETTNDARELSKKYRDKFDDILNGVGVEQWEEVQELIVACIACGSADVTHFAEQTLSRRKIIQWKKHAEIFDKIFDALIQYGQRSWSDKPDKFWTSKSLYYLINRLCELLDKVTIPKKKTEEKFYELISVALNDTNNMLIACIRSPSKHVSWEKDAERTKKVMQKSYDMVVNSLTVSDSNDIGSGISDLWNAIFLSFMSDSSKVMAAKALSVVDIVSQMFEHCAKAPWKNPDNESERTVCFDLLSDIFFSYLQRHKKVEMIKPVINTVLRLRKCEDEEVQTFAKNLLWYIEGDIADIMSDNVDQVVEDFIADPKEKTAQMSGAFSKRPEQFKHRVNDILQTLLSQNEEIIEAGTWMMREIGEKYPHELTPKTLSMVAKTLPMKGTYAFGILVLLAVARERKEEILPYADDIIKCMQTKHGMSSSGVDILLLLAKLGKSHALKYMDAMYKIAKSNIKTVIEDYYSVSMICAMNSLGKDYPEGLAKYKAFFEEKLTDTILKPYVEQSVDIIEGRSLKGVSKDLADQQEDLNQIDEKVTETDHRVNEASQNVKKIDENVEEIKTDVAEQSEKLNDLEQAVDETAEKAEEVSKKSLSHAPMWARDVARLMNPDAEYDWRFLAKRLSYSNDHIRNWALQPDPCLSMLDDWFASHKTREATFAVEQALNEMNRIDAAMIVENAMKRAEDVVEMDENEKWDPPPVFISYQWGHQQEVKLLHRHLEMAGYNSWMDIGQMGGGDKLFEKIDQGIRAAKVIICCVSEKYAKSANCNREVNLSVNLGKPMIPLLMEKMSWPPAGSMGPIFGEYIFVRFFARAGETAGDERYWPTAKFQELLMQLRFTHAPDSSLAYGDLYKDWWKPPVEITCEAKEKEDENGSPEVFISYQWGKQPQIIELYKTLTSKGYMCWLDIMQMGGGDSLYDKIDKGIRGCKVVISCVTSKYALSANCRREVSLADSLRKPIVPVLLEKCSWPPAGPMSMVFTQLLYIDFCTPNIEIQNSWKCPQMEELNGRLIQHLPRMKPIESDAKSKAPAESSANDDSKATETNETTNKDTPDAATTSQSTKTQRHEEKPSRQEPNYTKNQNAHNTDAPPENQRRAAKSSSCILL